MDKLETSGLSAPERVYCTHLYFRALSLKTVPQCTFSLFSCGTEHALML